jgi:hypothetical protein
MDITPAIDAEDDDRRIARRISVDPLAVINSNQRARTTRLVNISAGGALVGPMFGIEVGDRATLNVPGYGIVSGWVARITDDNYAAICFSPDPDFHQLCGEASEALVEMIKGSQLAFQNPHSVRARPHA